MSYHKQPGLILMLKSPRPGNVKTRLMPVLTGAEAATLATCFAQDVVAALRCFDYPLLMAYAPPEEQPQLEALFSGGIALLWTPQTGTDLGERLQHVTEAASREFGLGPFLILGTDSPTFPPEAIGEAFQKLQTAEVVLGPAEDGGYWCVGLQRPVPGLFENIPWSTETVLAQTVANAERLRLSIAEVAQWYDVDTPDDLERLRRDPFLAERAPLTAAWLSAEAAHLQTNASAPQEESPTGSPTTD